MKRKTLMAAAVSCALGVTLVGCVPAVEPAVEEPADPLANLSEDSLVTTSGQEVLDTLQKLDQEYAPTVKELEDGTKVQIVPDEMPIGTYGFDVAQPYNTMWLNAENRGCDSCHTDGLFNLYNYNILGHVGTLGGVPQEFEPQACAEANCHGNAGMPLFSEMIHQIHSKESFRGDCYSCHATTADGEWKLWEEARWSILSGILPVTSEDAAISDFSYDQDTITEPFEFLGGFWDGDGVKTWYQNQLDGVPNDESYYDEWEITVSGVVDQPYTATLAELIAELPSEKRVVGIECEANWANGNMMENVEITGIPIRAIIEKAGVPESALFVNDVVADGDSRGIRMEDIDDAYLVYEINGEKLEWQQGFPCRVVVAGYCADSNRRWVNELVVGDNPDEMGYIVDYKMENRPSTLIADLLNGQIIQAGVPYEFNGWSSDMGDQVVGVEVSFDQGETWTRFDTSSSDPTRLTHWSFTWTPEAEGAYVLMARSIAADGTVTEFPDRVMFNAKSEV